MVQKKVNLFFHRFLVFKLVNIFNKNGKKVIAIRFVKNIFLKLKLVLKKNPIILFIFLLKRLKPFIEIVKVRKSGKNYEVPVPLKKKRQIYLVFKWFVGLIKLQNSKYSTLAYDNYSKEICKFLLRRGVLVNYKRNLIKKAFVNRAYSHFRWS